MKQKIVLIFTLASFLFFNDIRKLYPDDESDVARKNISLSVGYGRVYADAGIAADYYLGNGKMHHVSAGGGMGALTMYLEKNPFLGSVFFRYGIGSDFRATIDFVYGPVKTSFSKRKEYVVTYDPATGYEEKYTGRKWERKYAPSIIMGVCTDFLKDYFFHAGIGFSYWKDESKIRPMLWDIMQYQIGVGSMF